MWPSGGAESGAISPGSPQIDPDISRLIRAWETLPCDIRRAILDMIEVIQRSAGIANAATSPQGPFRLAD